jgi:hypothetical protein
MVRTLLFVFAVWLLFTVFVTVFAASAKKNEVRNLPKWSWILICLFVPFVGGLLYLVLGRPAVGPKPRFSRTKTVAPDDDPTFLRDLSEKLDKEKPQEEKPPQEKTEEPDEDSGDGASKDKS